MTNILIAAVNALCLTLITAGGAAAAPVNSGVHNFNLFRTQLSTAVKQHDKRFVESIISPQIEMAIGGARGKAAFLKEWDDLNDNSIFWSRLQRVLEHGIQKDNQSDEYHAPAINIGDGDGNEVQGYVWNDKAPLYVQADSGAKIVGRLSRQQVNILEPDVAVPIESPWVKIRTLTKQIGYIRSTDIFSAYDEFAVFKMEHGQWRLTWFGFAGL